MSRPLHVNRLLLLAVAILANDAAMWLTTMAVGSALAFAGFVFGAALTMKVEYHRLLDEEAGLIRALRPLLD